MRLGARKATLDKTFVGRRNRQKIPTCSRNAVALPSAETIDEDAETSATRTKNAYERQKTFQDI